IHVTYKGVSPCPALPRLSCSSSSRMAYCPSRPPHSIPTLRLMKRRTKTTLNGSPAMLSQVYSLLVVQEKASASHLKKITAYQRLMSIHLGRMYNISDSQVVTF